MRTIGVSWLTKDWIASTRFTLGFRSTMRISTRSIVAIKPSRPVVDLPPTPMRNHATPLVDEIFFVFSDQHFEHRRRLIEVIFEPLERFCSIARVERVKDGYVLRDDDRQTPLHGGETMDAIDAGLDDVDRAPHTLQTSRDAERTMKSFVERVKIVGVFGSEGRRLPLDDISGLHAMRGAPQFGGAAQHGEFKRLAAEMILPDRAELDRRNETALLRKDFDQFVFDEADDRLAHRRARNADVAADPILADRTAWRKLQRNDRFLQRFVDLCADLTPRIKLDAQRQRGIVFDLALQFRSDSHRHRHAFLVSTGLPIKAQRPLRARYLYTRILIDRKGLPRSPALSTNKLRGNQEDVDATLTIRVENACRSRSGARGVGGPRRGRRCDEGRARSGRSASLFRGL